MRQHLFHRSTTSHKYLTMLLSWGWKKFQNVIIMVSQLFIMVNLYLKRRLMSCMGGPKTDFLLKHGLGKGSSLQEWFNAFLPLYDGTSSNPNQPKASCWSHQWANFLNMKSVILGAGVPGGIYPGFTPFSYEEIERFIGLYMLQGLNPSPQVEWKSSSQRTNPINGSDLCNCVFGKNAVKWHHQFKAFFCIQDPSKRAPERKH